MRAHIYEFDILRPDSTVQQVLLIRSWGMQEADYFGAMFREALYKTRLKTRHSNFAVYLSGGDMVVESQPQPTLTTEWPEPLLATILFSGAQDSQLERSRWTSFSSLQTSSLNNSVNSFRTNADIGSFERLRLTILILRARNAWKSFGRIIL